MWVGGKVGQEKMTEAPRGREHAGGTRQPSESFPLIKTLEQLLA